MSDTGKSHASIDSSVLKPRTCTRESDTGCMHDKRCTFSGGIGKTSVDDTEEPLFLTIARTTCRRTRYPCNHNESTSPYAPGTTRSIVHTPAASGSLPSGSSTHWSYKHPSCYQTHKSSA
eukprot:746434-Hanusia_phi.AAC.4